MLFLTDTSFLPGIQQDTAEFRTSFQTLWAGIDVDEGSFNDINAGVPSDSRMHASFKAFVKKLHQYN
jgi:hypothetical protein